MKKFLFMLVLVMFALTSCDNDQSYTLPNSTGGQSTVTATSYGIFNTSDKIEGVKYEVCVGNVVLSVIFSESVIIPVWLVGWHLWEPVGLDNGKSVKIVNGKVQPVGT